MRWFRVAPGLILTIAVGLVVSTRWSVLLANHPAYPVALGLALMVGLAMVSTGRISAGPPRPGRLALAGRGLGAMLAIVSAAALLWARPFPATVRAQDAMAPTETVRVIDGRTELRFEPMTPSGAGLIFYPGARVDPRAYAVLAREIAKAGHPVVILKCAFDIAFLCATPDVPGKEVWAVGGHSLGGVAGSRRVDALGADGVVFWASYPISDLSDLTIPVASISGTEDGLATPTDIEESQADLPSRTVFTAVSGGNHAYFGDYGAQRGDGQATIDRADAQRQIVEATLGLLDSTS